MGTMNHPELPPLTVNGAGAFTPPAGLTPDDCERLAQEADATRNNPTTEED